MPKIPSSEAFILSNNSDVILTPSIDENGKMRLSTLFVSQKDPNSIDSDTNVETRKNIFDEVDGDIELDHNEIVELTHLLDQLEKIPDIVEKK